MRPCSRRTIHAELVLGVSQGCADGRLRNAQDTGRLGNRAAPHYGAEDFQFAQVHGHTHKL
jgi:hypothetical protein